MHNTSASIADLPSETNDGDDHKINLKSLMMCLELSSSEYLHDEYKQSSRGIAYGYQESLLINVLRFSIWGSWRVVELPYLLCR